MMHQTNSEPMQTDHVMHVSSFCSRGSEPRFEIQPASHMPPLEPIQLLPMTPERDGTRAGLLSALGIAEGESAEAYMHYIESAWTYQGEWNDFLHLFIDVVHHFHGTSKSDMRPVEATSHPYHNPIRALVWVSLLLLI